MNARHGAWYRGRMQLRTIFRVINPSTGNTERFTSKAAAMKRAKARAKRECGNVGVEKAYEYPRSGVVTFNKRGAGVIWTSEWRSCPRGVGRARRRRSRR